MPLATLEEALLHPDCTAFLLSRMDRLRDVEVLEVEDDGTVLRRRRRMAPTPPESIPRFARKKMRPEMMEWTEVVTYDRRTKRFDYENIPNIPQSWQRNFTNRGSYQLRELGPARTEREITGVIELRVPLFGRLGEKLIWREVERTFVQEKAALDAFLRERF